MTGTGPSPHVNTPGAPSNTKGRTGALIAVLCLALVVRLTFWWFAGTDAPLGGDELEYQELAENLVNGRGFVGHPPFFPGQEARAWQPPLYPFTLALVYAVTGVSPPAARFFQILLGVGTVYLVWRLGTNLFPQGRHTRLVAALIVALYPGLVTHAHVLLSETLFIFLLVLAVGLAISARQPVGARRAIAAGAAGMAFGLATLTRGGILYFAPIVIAWLGLRTLWLPKIDARGAFRAAAFACAVLITLSPWVIRNTATFHRFVLLETKGGVGLWLGNNPYLGGTSVRRIGEVGVRERPLRELPADEVERGRAAYDLARQHIASEPGLFLRRAIARFAVFWGFERKTADVAAATRRAPDAGWHVPSKAAVDLASALSVIGLVLAALAGICCAPDDPRTVLLATLVGYFTLVHSVVHAEGRYHLQVVPFLALYAAWAVTEWRSLRPRLRSLRGAVVGIGAVVFVSVWCYEIAGAILLLSR